MSGTCFTLAASLSFRRTVSIRLAGETSVFRFSGDGETGVGGRNLTGVVTLVLPLSHACANFMATLALFVTASSSTGINVFFFFRVGGKGGDAGGNAGGGVAEDNVERTTANSLSTSSSSSFPIVSRLSSSATSRPSREDGEETASTSLNVPSTAVAVISYPVEAPPSNAVSDFEDIDDDAAAAESRDDDGQIERGGGGGGGSRGGAASFPAELGR